MGKLILIVDDEPMIRHLLQCLLQLDGFQVDEASDGVEALGKANAQRPDLILMDYMMPNMDGITAIQKLRKQPQTADVPIIMLTANAQPAILERSMRAGVNCFLDKNENMVGTLTQHIQKVLAASHVA